MLFVAVLAVIMPGLAWASPGGQGAAGTLAWTPAAAPVAAPAAAADDGASAVSGGFSLFHYYGSSRAGFYGTFAQRVTTGDHAVSIVGDVSLHFPGITVSTFLGGAQVAIYRTDQLRLSGRALAGFTNWDGSNNFAMQFTGVVELPVKKLSGMSIELEGGVVTDKESKISAGLVIQAGVLKRFGGR